jgi:uncharacterized protein (DUF58 family)
MEPAASPGVRFPRLRAQVRRLPVTREGLLWLAIATGLLLLGLIKSINLITLLASLLIVLIVWNGWMARVQLRRVRAERCDDEPAFAQTPFTAVVRLRNLTHRAAGGLEVRSATDGARRWPVMELAGGASVLLRTEVTYPRRGNVQDGSLHVSCGYPLGLAQWQRMDKPALSRVVFPQLGRLHRGQLRRLLSRRSPTRGQTRGLPCPAPTAQAEFHGLRAYRPGDSPRHVHWRTSARYGELMVREYEDWPNDDLTLILEARRAPGTDDDPMLELAIRMAATICWQWCRQSGDRLLLAVAGAAVTVDEGPTDRALALTLLERLALESGGAEIDEDRLVAELRRRRLSPGPILVISPRESDCAGRLQHALRRRVAPISADSAAAASCFEV